MFRGIAIVVVVVIAALLAYAAIQPDTFRVERATSIKAPPERVFALINDYRSWGAWSPWEKMDPEMKRSFSGPASGKGSQYAWEGNSKVGAGRMEITDSLPPSRVALKLDMLKPFEAHNAIEFRLEPRGDASYVSWTMSGPQPYLAKLVCIFVSMDAMVGKDFETGLANLKAAAEK